MWLAKVLRIRIRVWTGKACGVLDWRPRVGEDVETYLKANMAIWVINMMMMLLERNG